ncbi:hypothetical protein jhhlp_006162 [Lomentospora prolificans]|uniref:Pali-domain-containing protein n=1 Tax=Lomentospora prolificans TaxID=41688 RepID=A0A2N3N546_9PEZI|nr:hypothetical protein jhhlp_006162 [Lomentospora prolificans]
MSRCRGRSNQEPFQVSETINGSLSNTTTEIMKANFCHMIGSFLLLVATILLIVTSITAPVVNSLGILTVDLGKDSTVGKEVSFGTFGWCIEDAGPDGNDQCSEAKVGYNPADVMESVDGTEVASYSETTTKALTRVMVLHPVAAGLCFIAFILTLGAGAFGSFVASLIAFTAFLVTAIVMICDFVLFGILKADINENDDSESHAYFSIGMWCVLVSALCSLLASILVFITCCAGRFKKRRDVEKVPAATPASRRRFWPRR